jgi:hypothetical protein
VSSQSLGKFPSSGAVERFVVNVMYRIRAIATDGSSQSVDSHPIGAAQEREPGLPIAGRMLGGGAVCPDSTSQPDLCDCTSGRTRMRVTDAWPAKEHDQGAGLIRVAVEGRYPAGRAPEHDAGHGTARASEQASE